MLQESDIPVVFQGRKFDDMNFNRTTWTQNHNLLSLMK